MTNCRRICSNINVIGICTNDYRVTYSFKSAPTTASIFRPFTTEPWIRVRVSPCGICGGQNGTVTGFSPSCSVFPSQYHSTVAPGEWTVGHLVAAVQRHILTPSVKYLQARQTSIASCSKVRGEQREHRFLSLSLRLLICTGPLFTSIAESFSLLSSYCIRPFADCSVRWTSAPELAFLQWSSEHLWWFL
jgi:hypothetical protein